MFKQGFYIRGICKGFKTETRGQYTDNAIGISFQNDDGYGGIVDVLQEVDVYGDAVPKLRTMADGARGALVELKVYFKPMNGKNGPWIKYYAGRDTEVIQLEKAKQ